MRHYSTSVPCRLRMITISLELVMTINRIDAPGLAVPKGCWVAESGCPNSGVSGGNASAWGVSKSAHGLSAATSAQQQTVVQCFTFLFMSCNHYALTFIPCRLYLTTSVHDAKFCCRIHERHVR